VTLYVEGSEAGPLVSKRSAIGFHILTSLKTVLFISVFDEDHSTLLGVTTFSPARFVRENKYDPRLYQREEILCKHALN
jgi:hypothetical protein